MNVLEKILEEIEDMRDIMKSTVATDCFGKECEYNDCTVCVCERAMEIIRSHMDDVENGGWIPVDSDNQPKDEERVLVSFENFNEVLTARYKAEEEGGTFLLDADDTDESFVSNDLYVSAWQPLPDRYKGG